MTLSASSPRASFLSAILIASLLAASTSPALAADTVKINPTTLRENLLARNGVILDGVEQVIQAKDQVNVARAQMLPGINLGMVLSSSVGPSFVLSAVSFLLPFLLPSNWFNLHVSEHMLDAQKTSYYLLELNQYASAYALYAQIQGDLALREVVNQQYLDLKEIHDTLKLQDGAFGNITPQELNQAEAQAELALVQLSQMDNLLAAEKASLRAALSIPLDAQIEIEADEVPASSAENMVPSALLQSALAVAPEKTQISALIEAGKDGKWSKEFSFLSTLTLSGQTDLSNGVPNGVSLSHLSSNGSLSLGFGIFPSLQLSDDSVQELQLRLDEIQTEEGRIAETTLAALGETQKQLAIAQQAEASLLQNYKAELELYKMGASTLYNVLNAHQSLTTASTAKVKSHAAVDQARINLHRMLLSDQFAQIQGCQLSPEQSSSGFGDWLRGIFNPASNRVTIDEACRKTQ